MAYHYLHHGGPGTRNPNQELYPASKLIATDPLAPAAHKEPIAFGITRVLDFSQKDGRRQAGLQQYLERTAATGAPLQANDVVTLSALPGLSLLQGYAWAVEVPEAGVTFNLKLFFGGQVLATGINAASVGSNGALLTTPVWIKDINYLAAEFTAYPANGAKDLRFWVTPIVLVPKLGN